MIFRPYQNEGLADIYREWAFFDILMFVLATGGGKTVTFMEPVRHTLLSGKRAMVLAHREELIDNAWQTLYENKIYSGVVKGDRKTNYDLRCQVGSVQTVVRRKNLPFVDTLIIDEGHHCQMDNSYGLIISKLFDMNPALKVLIVTATPYRLSGDGFRWLHPMHETKLIINRTLHQLQDEGYLVPFRYFVKDKPDMSRAGIAKGDYKEEDAEIAMAKLAPLVDSYLAECAGKSGIVFAINIHHSQEIVKQYNARGIPAAHVDGETPGKLRLELFEKLRRKDILVLVNVGIATEGVDIPNIEFVQLGRPTLSLSLAMQMLGRLSRALTGVVDGDDARTVEQRKARIKASAKPFGYVLDNAGVLIEHTELLTGKIDWEKHFNGTKAKKKDDMIEILTFVAERPDGSIVKTVKAEEIIGLELIEVTKSNQQHIINLKSLKEFDKFYAMGKNMRHVQKPAYFAFTMYTAYCKKNAYLINDVCWNYLEDVLVKQNKRSVQEYEENMLKLGGPNALLNDEFSKAVARIKRRGMSQAQFDYFKREYDRERGE